MKIKFPKLRVEQFQFQTFNRLLNILLFVFLEGTILNPSSIIRDSLMFTATQGQVSDGVSIL